jgi:hypothetical protein
LGGDVGWVVEKQKRGSAGAGKEGIVGDALEQRKEKREARTKKL